MKKTPIIVAVILVLARIAFAQSFNLQCQSCTEQFLTSPTIISTPTPIITPTPTPIPLTPTVSLTPSPIATATVSPACASVPPQVQLRDGSSNIYTLDASGNVLVNGVSDAGGSSVSTLVWDGARLWAQSSTIWFFQTAANASWQSNGTNGPPACGGPTPSPSTSITPMPSTSPTPIASVPCVTTGLCGPIANSSYRIVGAGQQITGDCCLYAVPGDVTSQCIECNTSNLAALDNYNSLAMSAAYCATRHGINGCP